MVRPGNVQGAHYRAARGSEDGTPGAVDVIDLTDDVPVPGASGTSSEADGTPVPGNLAQGEEVAAEVAEVAPAGAAPAGGDGGAEGRPHRRRAEPLVSWKARLSIVIAFAVFLVALVDASPMRGVGDGGEYLIMADKLAHFERPRVDQTEFPKYSKLFSDVGGYMGIGVAYRKGDPGPYEFNHFWAYSLTVAPALRVTEHFHFNPVRAFTITNAVLLLVALGVVLRRLHWAPTLLVFAGPAIWWVDKTHSEVFTFSLLAMALALMRDKPIGAMLLAGCAAAHNFPIGALVAGIALFAVLQDRGLLRRPRFWVALAVSAALSVLSPLYFQLTIHTSSPQSLNGGVNPHVPTFKQYVLPLLDLNNGILVAAPLICAATVAGLMVLGARWRSTSWLQLGIVAAVAAWFLFSFGQTGNFNHGATPSMTRYGNWLIPMALVVFLEVQRTGGLPRFARRDALTMAGVGVVALSAMASVVMFHPKLSDGLHRPTPVANWVWNHHPSWDDPVVEVFWERTSQFEGNAKTTANAACTKVLEVRGEWPSRCGPAPVIPAKCQMPRSNACYANRSGRTWQWVPVSGVPGYDTPGVDVGDIQERVKRDGVSKL